jgi:hypothetical protein
LRLRLAAIGNSRYAEQMTVLHRRVVFVSAILGATIVAQALTPGCTKPQQGTVMLAMQTDMQVDSDVSAVGVYVNESPSGRVLYQQVVRAAVNPSTGKNTVQLPATLAINRRNGSATVRVRIVAFRASTNGDGTQVPTAMNEALATVPSSAVVRLPLALTFISRNTVKGPSLKLTAKATSLSTLANDSDLAVPDGASFALADGVCPAPKTQTLDNAGNCVEIPNYGEADLPPYSETAVFGGGTSDGRGGSCFDVRACVQGGRLLTIDALPQSGATPSEFGFAIAGGAVDFAAQALIAVFRAEAQVGLCPAGDAGFGDSVAKCFVALNGTDVKTSAEYRRLESGSYRFDADNNSINFGVRARMQLVGDPNFLGFIAANQACGPKTWSVPRCDQFPQAQTRLNGSGGAIPNLDNDGGSDAAADSSADAAADSGERDASNDSGADAGVDAAAPAVAPPIVPEPRPSGLAIFGEAANRRVFFARNGNGAVGFDDGFASVDDQVNNTRSMKYAAGDKSTQADGYRMFSLAQFAAGNPFPWGNAVIATFEGDKAAGKLAAAFSITNTGLQSVYQMTLPVQFHPTGVVAAPNVTYTDNNEVQYAMLLMVGRDDNNFPKAHYYWNNIVSLGTGFNLGVGEYPTAVAQKDGNQLFVGTNLGGVYTCTMALANLACTAYTGSNASGSIVDLAYKASAPAVLAALVVGGDGNSATDGIYTFDQGARPKALALRGQNPDIYFEPKSSSVRNNLAISNGSFVYFSSRADALGNKPSRVWSAPVTPGGNIVATALGGIRYRASDLRIAGFDLYFVDHGDGTFGPNAISGLFKLANVP